MSGVLSETTLGFNEEQSLHIREDLPLHPESPQRIIVIKEWLNEIEILNRCRILSKYPIVEIDRLIELGVHSTDHVKSLLSVAKNPKLKEIIAKKYDSVYVNEHSFDVALSAASCAIFLCDLIISGKIPNGFAITRPPGHHAQHSQPNGFCLLNNVALTARHALSSGLTRILIVDFDVHHGQGVQYEFFDSPEVLYFSVHRYENGGYWPHLRESDFDYIGTDKGKGFNVNVPMNETRINDSDFLYILQNILLPLATEFNPELIIYSAGFDSCDGDPLGDFALTPNLYANWIFELSRICSRQLLVLEGGYNHRVQRFCVQRCIETLMGQHPKQIKHTEEKQRPNPSPISHYEFPTECPPNTGVILQENLPQPFSEEDFRQ